MGYTDWSPVFRQGIIDRMLAGESARQLSKELNKSRTNIQKLFDEYMANRDVPDVEITEEDLQFFHDDYIKSIWEGFLKQDELGTINEAYYNPNINYFIDTTASKDLKDTVKYLYDNHIAFEDTTIPERSAIGFVIKDIRAFGKHCIK